MSTVSAYLIRELLRVAPGHLRSRVVRQRWFADKDREILDVSILDYTCIGRSASVHFISLVRFQFTEGPPSLYAVPFILTPDAEPDAATWFSINVAGQTWRARDAIGDEFGTWLVECIGRATSIDTRDGRIEASRFAELTSDQLSERAEPVSTEHSNSSLLYETMIAKIYRRLSEGENPDVEVGLRLTEDQSFPSTPQIYGSLEYVGPSGRFTLAMLQSRIDSPRDGWSLLLDSLTGGSPLMHSIGRELGQLTAEMHLALASPTDDPAFASTPASSETVESWRLQTVAAANEVVVALSSSRWSQAAAVHQLTDQFRESFEEIVSRTQGYAVLTAFPLIRVHGDYHLGQVLLDSHGKWWVVDFEGEPLRSIAHRTLKTSPLKDVAGMLRSFAYAGGAVETGHGSAVDLEAWEQKTREEFLDAYLTVLRRGQPELLPLDDDQLFGAIRAWELDKALYEVLYELSSRPDWVWLPLSSIVKTSTGLAG